MSRWPEAPLLEVAHLSRGTEPGSASYSDASRGVRFLRVGDVTGKTDNPVFTESPDVLLVAEADLLLTLDGSPGHVSIGHKGAISSGIRRVEPAEPGKVSRAWLKYSLMSPAVQETIHRHTTGVTILHASAALPHIRIPLAPRRDQERIVRILDEAAALRRLRAETDERASQLAAALFEDKFGGVLGEALSRVVLADLAEVVSGVTKGRKLTGRPTIEAPYLRVANVQAGHIDLAEVKTIEALPEEIEQLALRKGDVLLTEGGDFDKLGRGAIWEHDIRNCIHQNHIFRVRVDRSILDPIFFEKFLLTREARVYFLRCAKRTTNLASINMTQLRGLPVPLPTLSEQRAFASRVAEIRELEKQQAASRQRLDDLFQSLLHRAFQGEL